MENKPEIHPAVQTLLDFIDVRDEKVPPAIQAACEKILFNAEPHEKVLIEEASRKYRLRMACGELLKAIVTEHDEPAKQDMEEAKQDYLNGLRLRTGGGLGQAQIHANQAMQQQQYGQQAAVQRANPNKPTEEERSRALKALFDSWE